MEVIRYSSLICSDIRNEIGGGESLVGVFNDNLQFERLPVATNLAVYTRLTLSRSSTVEPLTIVLATPSGLEISIASVEVDELVKIRDATPSDSINEFGLKSFSRIANFVFDLAGDYIVNIRFGSTEVVSARLKVKSLN